MRHKVDVRLYALFGKKGAGKSTLAIALAIIESVNNGLTPIISNMKLNIPGIVTIQKTKISELIEQCNNDPCTCTPRVIIADEFDKSFTSRIGWVEKEREQKLVELVSNIRKHNCIAFIASSQLKKKIKNDFRHNCDFVLEPTGTCEFGQFPEFFIWKDVELYETAGRARYDSAEFCASPLTLDFLETTFDTRQTIILEWD